MDELTYNALNSYFKRIESVGYMQYGAVDSLLVLLYIYYLKDNYDLSQEESRIVHKALNCIQGSNCMIPYN